MLQPMKATGSLERLSERDCLRLMSCVPVGRIVYTVRALPAVEPVNFAVDGGAIVLRTDPGGKLNAAIRQAVVAFEVDELDYLNHDGWSVTVVGIAREVTEPAEVARLRQIGLDTWVPGDREHFIRIVPGIISGRRLAHVRPVHGQAV